MVIESLKELELIIKEKQNTGGNMENLPFYLILSNLKMDSAAVMAVKIFFHL